MLLIVPVSIIVIYDIIYLILCLLFIIVTSCGRWSVDTTRGHSVVARRIFPVLGGPPVF